MSWLRDPVFTRFYEYEPPRDPEDIEEDILELADEFQSFLWEVLA